jgi:hypothetical protein
MSFLFFTFILSPICGIKNSKYDIMIISWLCSIYNPCAFFVSLFTTATQYVIAQNLLHLPHAGLVLIGKPTQKTTAVYTLKEISGVNN